MYHFKIISFFFDLLLAQLFIYLTFVNLIRRVVKFNKNKKVTLTLQLLQTYIVFSISVINC